MIDKKIESTNQQNSNLYFIALIPNETLQQQVKELKEEMRDNYGAAHALKSPAHITLQMPFRRKKGDESKIIEVLQKFTSTRKSFQISLSGFDCFDPRVIFIKVLNHDPVKTLHTELKKVLAYDLDFGQKELRVRMHPHMTIATRDLNEKAFHKAWPKYQQREFEAEFEAKSIFLLKHNGKYWDVFKEFLFNG